MAVKATTGPEATSSGGVACGSASCGMEEVSGDAARAVWQPSPNRVIAAAAKIFRMLFPVDDMQERAARSPHDVSLKRTNDRR